MAVIRSTNLIMDEKFVVASISDEENKNIRGARNVLIIPEEFNESLTTGKLGNSNRIMLPKKF